jgi:hypothetical protein
MKILFFRILILILTPFSLVFTQNVGEVAPNFQHSTLDNGTIQLSDFSGKVVLLFFVGYS